MLAAAQCIVIGPVCLSAMDGRAGGVCGWVCYHDNLKLCASIQLIKFWPSRAPGKGVCGGAKIFGSGLLQPVRSVCVSLSALFHIVPVPQ